MWHSLKMCKFPPCLTHKMNFLGGFSRVFTYKNVGNLSLRIK